MRRGGYFAKLKLVGRAIYAGRGAGRALVTTQPLSFYGGVDPSDGVVIEHDHELAGKSVAGRVLVFPNGKGSTVGSYILYRLSKNGFAPAAIVNEQCETIVAVGAIISGIPCVDKVDLSKIVPDSTVQVSGRTVTLKT